MAYQIYNALNILLISFNTQMKILQRIRLCWLQCLVPTTNQIPSLQSTKCWSWITSRRPRLLMGPWTKFLGLPWSMKDDESAKISKSGNYGRKHYGNGRKHYGNTIRVLQIHANTAVMVLYGLIWSLFLWNMCLQQCARVQTVVALRGILDPYSAWASQ